MTKVKYQAVKTICFASIAPTQRSELTKKAEELNLTVVGNFTNDVHILVADSVARSDKCRNATLIETPIVQSQWLEECSLRGKLVDYKAYILPRFKGIHICATQLTTKQKDLVEKLCKENDIGYSKNLWKEVTHLIAQEPSGEKYQHAVIAKMQVVSVDWLKKSVSEKQYLDEDDFRPLGMPERDIENIKRKTTRKPQSSQSTLYVPSTQQPQKKETVAEAMDTIEESMDVPDEEEEEESEHFLDGCKIYLHGFTNERRQVATQKLRNAGAQSARSLNMPSLAPTMIIVDDTKDSAEIAKNNSIPVVKYAWLLECDRTKSMVPYDDYLVGGRKELPKPVTKTKTESKSSDSDEPKPLRPTRPKSPRKSPRKMKPKTEQTEDTVAPVTMDFSRFVASPRKPVKKEANSTTSSAPIAVSPQVEEPGERKLFTGIRFHIHSDLGSVDRTAVLKMLKEFGGIEEKVMENAQFIIWPRVVYSVHDVDELMVNGQHVTVNWLEECAKRGKLPDIKQDYTFEPLFYKRPDYSTTKISMKNGNKPLISHTGYDATLKDEFKHLIDGVGAEYNHKMSKRVDYLITEKNNSEKYKFAVKQNTPVMTLKWMIESFKQGRLIDPEGYYFRKPEDDDSMNSVASATTASTAGSSAGMFQNSESIFDVKGALNFIEETSKKPRGVTPPKIVVQAPTPLKETVVEKKISPKIQEKPKEKPVAAKKQEQFNFSDTVRNLMSDTSVTMEETDSSNLLQESLNNSVRMTRKDLESGSFYSTQRQQEMQGYDLLQGVNTTESAADRDYNERVLNSRKEVARVDNMSGVVFTNLESQSDVRWDINRDKNELMKQVMKKSDKMGFATSGGSPAEVIELKRAIEELGGDYYDNIVPGKTTHFIAYKPNKTEKVLSALASNAWVLHPEYIKESSVNGGWQDEFSFIWSRKYAESTAVDDLEKTYEICDAIEKNGRAIQDALDRRVLPRKKFTGWRVVLEIGDEPKTTSTVTGLVAVLEAGGATVLATSTEGWKKHKNLTHVIITNKVIAQSSKYKENLMDCHNAGIIVWIQGSLVDVLFDKSTPNPSIFDPSSRALGTKRKHDLISSVSSNESQASDQSSGSRRHGKRTRISSK